MRARVQHDLPDADFHALVHGLKDQADREREKEMPAPQNPAEVELFTMMEKVWQGGINELEHGIRGALEES